MASSEALGPFSPAVLVGRWRVFARRARARASLLLSARPSCRAAFHTPVNRTSLTVGYARPRWPSTISYGLGIHHTHAQVGSRVEILSGLQSSLDAAARHVASLSPTKTFTFELSRRQSPAGASNMTTRANRQLPGPVSHRLDTQPCRLQRKFDFAKTPRAGGRLCRGVGGFVAAFPGCPWRLHHAKEQVLIGNLGKWGKWGQERMA